VRSPAVRVCSTARSNSARERSASSFTARLYSLSSGDSAALAIHFTQRPASAALASLASTRAVESPLPGGGSYWEVSCASISACGATNRSGGVSRASFRSVAARRSASSKNHSFCRTQSPAIRPSRLR
jgi:hypothetical protein